MLAKYGCLQQIGWHRQDTHHFIPNRVDLILESIDYNKYYLVTNEGSDL